MPTYRVSNNSRTVVQVWGQHSGGWANTADLTSGLDMPDTVSQPPQEWDFPQKPVTFGGAPLKRLTFDNGTEGVSIDDTNTASSGAAVGVPIVAGAADAVFAASAAIRGTKGCHITAPSAADTYTLFLTGLALPSATGQIYFRVDSARYPGTVSAIIGRIRSASANAAICLLTTTGVFQLQNAAGSTLQNFNGNVALPDGDYWMDLRATMGASSSTGTIMCQVFNADTGELIDSYYANNINAGTANLTQFQWGKPIASGTVDLDVDEPAFSTGTTEQIFPIPVEETLEEFTGTADVDISADINASGALVISDMADEDISVVITASGVVDTSTSSDEDVSVAITASGVVIANTSASEDVSVGITATGGLAGQFSSTADRTVSVTVTASGALAGQATRAATVTITAAAMAAGQADRASPVGITTSGALAAQASESVTIGITASGVVSLVTSASQTLAATISASGQLVGAPSGTATVTENVDITATGQLLTSSTASRASTVGITASGALVVSKAATAAVTVGTTASGVLLLNQQADRVQTVTLTATGLFTGSSTASQDSTVTISAVGSLILFGAASMNITADITPIGSGGLRYTYRDVAAGTTPRPDSGTTSRILAGATYRV